MGLLVCLLLAVLLAVEQPLYRCGPRLGPHARWHLMWAAALGWLAGFGLCLRLGHSGIDLGDEVTGAMLGILLYLLVTFAGAVAGAWLQAARLLRLNAHERCDAVADPAGVEVLDDRGAR